jgi:hypothetical protein
MSRTDRPSLMRRVDRAMGLPDFTGSGLNWKGREVERFHATSRTAIGVPTALVRFARSGTRRIVRRMDRAIGAPCFSGSGLNWKGRIVERVLAVAQIPRVLTDVPRGISAPYMNRRGELNWKGRVIELIHALRRRLSRVLVRAAFRFVNATAFLFYLARKRLRRRDRVRSVLQLSLISHKPFMVSRVLRAHGIRSDFFAINVSDTDILNVGWDYALRADVPPRKRKALECFYLWTVLARYDVIHSHFKTLLSDTGWEFEYLKQLGSVVVFNYRGCDIRYRSLNMRLQPELNCCQECDYPIGSCDTDYQRSQVALTAKYGDAFFVTTPDLLAFAPEGAEHLPFIHPVGIDFDRIRAADKRPGVFRAVTSSNHHGIDGTPYIRAAVDRLRREGCAIELVEVSNLSYREALAVYKSADVYVGKLRMGYYNNANIETMMLGVANMSYIRADFTGLFPDCPIINTTPDTVYDRLRYYVERPTELRAIGALGPAFVRERHDPAIIARRLIATYNELFSGRVAAPAATAGTRLDPFRKPLSPRSSRS